MGKKHIMLSVVLAVHNEAANIDACLLSVRDIADEMIVVDGASTDDTARRAKALGAQVIPAKNTEMFHTNKQRAVDEATGDWILQLDADEVVSPALRDEIILTINAHTQYNGYALARHNYFLGDWLRKGGSYPDYVIRLFKRGKGSFPQKSVHEQIHIEGQIGHLTHALDHYSYTSVPQYWRKSMTYIRLTAKTAVLQRSRAPLCTFWVWCVQKPVKTFFAMWLRHKGILDGWRGTLFALFSSLHFPVSYVISFTLPKHSQPAKGNDI